jgi:hypothetical protein
MGARSNRPEARKSPPTLPVKENPMKLSMTMLAGAAVCALVTSPAFAAKPPMVNLAGTVANQIKMQSGASHSKTVVHDSKYVNYTTVLTFSGTIPESTFYKTPVLLWAEAWYDPSTCTEPAQKGKVAVKSTVAKIGAGTTTGTISGCGSTTFTYYGPLYTLKSKTATSDSFTYDVIAKHTSSGYNLYLVGNTNLNISH